MRRLLALILLSALACGCAAPPAGGSTSAGVEVEEPPLYRNLAGAAIDPWSEEVSGIALNYTLGWKAGEEGYLRLEKDSQWGDAAVTEAGSQYYFYRPDGGPVETTCVSNSYAFTCPSAIPGILQVEEDSIVFFPYQTAGIPMLFLHPRLAQEEKDHAARGRASLRDGTTLEVHPIGIRLRPVDEERIRPLLPGDGRSFPCWYDARLRFSSVWVSGFCQAITEGVTATRANGDLEWEDPAEIEGELLLTERLWVLSN